MAKAKVLLADQQSQEFDELRKTVNTILLLLEMLSTTNSALAANLLTSCNAIGDAITNGVAGTAVTTAPGREVLGQVTKMKKQQFYRVTAGTVTLNPAEKNV